MLILLLHNIIILLLLCEEGEDRREGKRVQTIIRASRMMMEGEVAPSAKPESL